jgi:hypothetical protein
MALAKIGIQAGLDSFAASAPNQRIHEISSHFQGLSLYCTHGPIG